MAFQGQIGDLMIVCPGNGHFQGEVNVYLWVCPGNVAFQGQVESHDVVVRWLILLLVVYLYLIYHSRPQLE